MTTEIQVLLVDDHPFFRQGLGVLIGLAPELHVAGEAGSMDEVRDVVSRTTFDVAVVDVWLAVTSGIAVVNELRERRPECRVLGLSVVEEPAIIAEMLRAGALGYALKTERPEHILQAIRQTATGDHYLSPTLPRDDIELELLSATHDDGAELTKREREILELVVRGFTISEIASRLFISRRTVETHRYRITKKLHAHTPYELQRAALRCRP